MSTTRHGENGPDRAAAARAGSVDGTDAEPTPGGAGPDQASPTRAGERGVRALLVPRWSATHVVGALLCVALGFAVVAQVSQTQDDVLTGMRQDDLVRLLDDLNQRNAELTDEQEELRQDLAELRSSTSSRQAAQEAAEEQARVQGVLAGTLPVRGPGVVLTIRDPEDGVRAQHLVTILEEMRNAGVEAVELSGQRLTASSWILDGEDGIVVDGVALEQPWTWTAIGDPDVVSVALGIPGGALATVRAAGATVVLREVEDVEITAVRTLDEPEFAEPAAPTG